MSHARHRIGIVPILLCKLGIRGADSSKLQGETTALFGVAINHNLTSMPLRDRLSNR